MSNIIDSIQLSGVTYTLSAETSGGNNVVELTQAQYDALVTGGTVDPTAFYIITDATAGDLTQYWTSAQTQSAITSAVSGKASQSDLETVSGQVANKQDTLVSGTNIKTINNESILGSGNIDIQGGGGKAVSGGTNISVTTGETADTINCTLPIVKIQGYNSVIIGDRRNTVNGDANVAVGYQNSINGKGSSYTPEHCFVGGKYNNVYNNDETAFGTFNNSVQNTLVGGESGTTLFSVGNGTSNNARHNAFEIRQNGDIYITKDGQDVKLQDQLGGGGGGSSYTAGDGIDITNDVISVTGKADTSAVTAIQDSLSGYVTTDTEQIISGRKIFRYSSNTSKAIEFKQTDDSSKVGFMIKNSASTNNEVASFEFRPNTFTIDGVQHPLMYFGHYRNKNTANAGVQQTVIGFRQYDQLNAAAYHYLLPLPEKAKTPFSLTTSFKDYYAPMGFKNGSTMITADDTGVVDLSSELGGLKLKKLTQAEYDALSPNYDSNTLYVIVN